MDETYTYHKLAALRDKVKWDIPANYFEELPARILAKIAKNDLAEMQKDIEPVADKYFDTFFSRLKTRIETEESELHTPILDTIPKDSLWEVPKGYFEDFSSKILENAEEKSIAPILFSLEKIEEPVPVGYFEALPAQIAAKIHTKEKEKVIAFVPNWASRIRNYSMAVAASVALILGGIWLMPSPQATTEPDFVPNFSNISTEELAQAIEEEDVDDELLAEVLPVNYTTETEKDLPQIDDISEEELVKYLEKEGEL